MRDAGWLELRQDAGDGDPLASGVEAAIIADALGEAVADVPFAGPILAADLARRAGARPIDGAVVAFSPDLIDAAVVSGPATDTPILAVDHAAQGPVAAYVLVPEGDGYHLALVEADGASDGADLTRDDPLDSRPACRCSRFPTSPGASRATISTPGRRSAWRSRAPTWSGSCGACSTSRSPTRRSGSSTASPSERFQAVQHLLAEARCLMEGAFSAALYPAWAVDQLGPDEARAAGRVAKAYCARAARTVCETAVQVHGGMGNTWDCIVHVHLRRALLSSQWFGDDGEQLRQLRADPSRGDRWTFVTRRRKRSSGRGCAPGSPSTTRVCRSPRPTTSTGPGRRSGTRRCTTRASSASPGPPASAVTTCPRSSTSSSTRSSPPPARRRARASATSSRGSRRTPARRSSSASCPA